MAELRLTWDGGGNFIRFERAVELLGNRRQAEGAFRRAINHAGDKMRTRVVRALAKQTGLTVGRLRKLKQPTVRRADNDRLEYVIRASGRPLSLKEFSPRQFRAGVRARPWGKRQMFEGAFIFAGRWNSGKPVAGGHVFKRTSGDSKPIEKLWGPSLPEELVRGEVAEAYHEVKLDLGPRIDHEVRRLTGGVVG